MSELQILPAVLHDAAEAARWYDEEGYFGLGDRFIGVFLFLRLAYQRAWQVLPKPFPYALYFRYHHRWLIISLVIHTARRPGTTRQLLRNRKSSTESE
jgi:hypothetical protein